MAQKPYLPKHIRDALQVTEHDLRAWRERLPPHRDQVLRKGESPGFSYGDLIGFGIIKKLTSQVGVSMGALEGVSEEVFHYCNSMHPFAMRKQHLVLNYESSKCLVRGVDLVELTATNLAGLLSGQAIVLLSIEDVVVMVDSYLAEKGFIAQQHFPFPPTQVVVNVPKRKLRKTR